MGFSKQQLLARLKELQIPFSQYEHPVVLTVDAQDKKSRLYVVSALAGTKVMHDFVGLREFVSLYFNGMAPEEALGEVLQVPLGCVTPFALVNESARDFSLLLDQGFKSQKHCFFHPLSNDMSISKVVKPSSGRKSSKGTPAKNVNSSGSFADAGQFVEEILQKTSQLLLSEVKDENIKLHGEQLGTVLSDKLLKNLNAEFKNLAMIFKNTAYTEGFHAGTHYRPPLM
ncbi:hypothetical protein HKD37_04G011790 [Glycine soja]